jgi:hypothetical protein
MVDNTTASTVSGRPTKENVMRRNEVLSLLERFPELVDGDDDLLHELIAEAGPELPEREDQPRSAHSTAKSDERDWTTSRPR